MAKMTPKQELFVKEYLVDLNATQAAIRAGYSPKTAEQQGPRLLGYAGVAAAIAAALEERSARVELSQDYVISNLTEVVERCMERAPVMVRRGRNVVQEIDEDGRHVWRFDAKGATAALQLLGKHLGMFVDRGEASVYDFNPHDFNRDGLKRVAAGESPQHVLASGGGRDA